MIAATRDQMRAIDAMAIHDYHIPGILLMEHAAVRVTERVVYQDQNLPVVVVCGVGNNGGDGLAVARLVRLAGRKVQVVLVGDLNHHTDDAKTMYRAILGLDIQTSHIMVHEDCEVLETIGTDCVVVDALFGISCSRPLEGFYKRSVQWMNQCSYVISVDVPSGICADTGKPMGTAVKANETVTFTLPKIGLLVGEGRHCTGQLTVVDIGIPEPILDQFVYNYELIDGSILRLLPERNSSAHKMTFGRLLVIAGSKSMSGAAILAAKAAYRSGAGLVEVVTHTLGVDGLHHHVPEAIVHNYEDVTEGCRLLETISQRAERYDAVLIGPGISRTELAQDMMLTVFKSFRCPLVIDADGLHWLPQMLDVLDNYADPVVITPHIGEMSRLVGHNSQMVIASAFDYADAYSKAHDVITVLKSDQTIVAKGNGQFCINMLGNEGMATAGSGDVLAGVILSLLGQKMDPYEAAVLGVGVHSLAGDTAAHSKGTDGLMATDIIDSLSYVIREGRKVIGRSNQP